MNKKELLDTLEAILADVHFDYTNSDYPDKDYYQKKVSAMLEVINFIEDNYTD